jgi:uracil-DNA glycosylase
MGFCYPGTGKAGDNPPWPECAVKRRRRTLEQLENLQLTLVIGCYALDYHLPPAGRSVTSVVMSWRDSWPEIVPLPHPSPRNNRWLRNNPWFEAELIPQLQQRIAFILGA